jgi:hypothetical protein
MTYSTRTLCGGKFSWSKGQARSVRVSKKCRMLHRLAHTDVHTTAAAKTIFQKEGQWISICTATNIAKNENGRMCYPRENIFVMPGAKSTLTWLGLAHRPGFTLLERPDSRAKPCNFSRGRCPGAALRHPASVSPFLRKLYIMVNNYWQLVLYSTFINESYFMRCERM